MRTFGVVLVLFLTVSTLWGQSLYLVPHYNYNLAFCRVSENSQGTASFRSRNFDNVNGNFGVFAEYQSNTDWRLSTGITIGTIGVGYQFVTNYTGTIYSVGQLMHSTNSNYLRMPLIFMYDWQDVRLFRLRNYRKPGRYRPPAAEDESIFYAFLFKIQPIVGASINHFGKIGLWGGTGITPDNLFISGDIEIYRPVEQLRTVTIAAIIGVRLQFYSFGKDRFALTALYHQGLQDVLEMNASYTIDGSDPYFSTVRSRGSGLSFTLSYPIRIFTFDKEERQLRKQNK